MSADSEFFPERPEPRPVPVTEWVPADQSPDVTPRHAQIAPHFYGLSLGMFAATCLTTFFVGTMLTYGTTEPDFSERFRSGLYYSAAVMTILLCHEMGHYLQSLRYGIPALPPLFIPVPLPPFGTMGAVILQQAGIGNRRQIFDVAISGPLAGLAATLPILYFGLKHANFVEIFHPGDGGGAITLGDPLLLSWMADWLLGPKPEGFDLQLNPLLHAGWLGVFITALNLFPIGQLDGGHILYTLIGRRAHLVAQGIVLGAAGWIAFTGNYSYLPMLVLISLFGIRHRATADDSVAIGWPRALLGWATLAFLVIGFTPNPITVSEPGEVPVQSAPEVEPVFPRRPLQPDEIEV